MNLMVVKGLLKKTKVQIVTCNNGRECLERMQKEHFHIILLDHMMPGMDGMEVIKRTRTLENNMCTSTPIIALTANALKGMKEMYLEAGFTDYLSKPVDGEKLEQMVRKYLPEELVHTPEEEVQACSGTSTSNPIVETATEENDTPLIDQNTAMVYCGNDEELYREILDCYCLEKEENQEKMKKCLEDNNLADYRILIHALKSTSLNIGCKSLYNMALELEKACKNNDLDYVKENHAACMELYDRVVEAGTGLLSRGAPTDTRSAH